MRSARWGAKEAVLPGRAEGRRPIPNTHRSDASFEHRAECSVIVANEIFRRRVPWERFSDLARQPLGRRAAGHRKPQQLPTFVAENKNCEDLLKRNRRNHEQINRRNPLHMIAQEGLPSLQWPIPPPIRGLSYTFRKSPVAHDCVVGPRGFEPPTRPLYPDVSGAYASHRLPIIARYFLERRTIGIGLRHVRRLRPRSGTDFVEQLADKT